MAEGAQDIDRDRVYFLDNLFFKVEGTFFSVPKQGFDVPGTAFNEMFAFPPGEGQAVEGTNEDRPISLPVSKREFRNFLRVMYPFLDDGGPQATMEGWMDALRLSSMWMFKRIKQHAIQNLAPFVSETSPTALLEKFKLAQEFDIQEWMQDCYIELAHSEAAINYESLLAAGVDPMIIVQIAKTRESVWASYTDDLTYEQKIYRAVTRRNRCSNCRQVGLGKDFSLAAMCRSYCGHGMGDGHLGDGFHCYGCRSPLSGIAVKSELSGPLSTAFRWNGSVFSRDP